MKHAYDEDTDRCICGCVVVYWETPDRHGEGCESFGPWPKHVCRYCGEADPQAALDVCDDCLELMDEEELKK